MTLPFEKVYCLHLAEDKEREKNIINEFKRLKIQDQVEIWWTCRRNISEIVANSIESLKTEYYIKHQNNVSFASVFNCALEHYTIIKQSYLRGFNNVCIMEDDIKFIDNINNIEHFFKCIPNDYDVLKLWSTEMEDWITPHRGREKVFVKYDKENDSNFLSTLFYALSRNGMKEYIKLMEDTFTPSDMPFKKMSENNSLTFYEPLYKIASPNNILNSNIENNTYFL